MKINHLKLALSMIIPFLTVFGTLFVALILERIGWEYTYQEFFSILLASSPSWGISVIVCLFLELGMLKSSGEKKKLKRLLIIETIVASILALHLFLGILLLGTIGNIVRYQWLNYKERVYN